MTILNTQEISPVTTHNFFNLRVASAILAVAILVVAIFFTYQSARKDIILIVDGKEQQVYGFGVNVSELLQENSIVFNEYDRIAPTMDTKLVDGLTVNIRYAIPVQLRVGYQEHKLMTAAETIGEVLKDEGISLGKLDLVSPALTEKLNKDTSNIQVDRITTQVIEVKEPIPYEVQRKEDATLLIGLVEEENDGKDGELKKVWEKVYKNGVMTEKKLLSSNVLEEPVHQIIKVGTKKITPPPTVTPSTAPPPAAASSPAVFQVASRGESELRFSKSFNVVATAYTHTGNRTSTGVMPYVGVVAVDPSVIPMGSNLYIEGYGYGKALDVGSAIKGNRIDVFLNSEGQAVQWGRRTVKIYVLE